MTHQHHSLRMPVIIDTDPGVDDAIAILMALACPEMDILGFTTTAGNVPLARATRNTLALLDYVGRSEIPVFRGASRPVRGRFAYARHVHSPSGLTRRLPDPKTSARSETAVRFMADTLARLPDQVTLIALGPLTNLARFSRQRPTSIQAAKRIIVMGGAVGTSGNATAHAEFNFHSDPTAARMVIESGIPVTLVDLGVCRKVYISRSDVCEIGAGDKPGRLAKELLTRWFEQGAERERFNLYDPLAIAATADHGVLNTRQVTLEVDDADTTDDSYNWGRCRITNDQEGPISVCDAGAVDGQRALGIIGDLLGWTRSGPE